MPPQTCSRQQPAQTLSKPKGWLKVWHKPVSRSWFRRQIQWRSLLRLFCCSFLAVLVGAAIILIDPSQPLILPAPVPPIKHQVEADILAAVEANSVVNDLQRLAATPPLHGHFPFAEVPRSQLMTIASYSNPWEQRFEQLHHDAGLALLKLIDAARLDGVWIVPVSGFRDVERQNMLFQLQIDQQGSAEAAAATVAPPGFSEHHTGYAIDLSDGLTRAADVSIPFGQTKAFRWLSHHAQEFGFELSFPPGNPQGVNYEPWHWRYVGSPQAKQIFAQARNPDTAN